MPDPAELQRLFELAIRLPPDERRACVERETEDPALREEVLGLLRHHELAGETLDTPAAERFGSLLLPPVDSLDEFTLIRELGRGGMGVVYLARDEELGRLAAVKLLKATHLDSELAIGRLRHEAKAVAGLSHSSIVPIYRYGHEQDLHFLAMEYVEGLTFEEWLSEAAGGGDATRSDTGQATGGKEGGSDAPPAVGGLLDRAQIREAISVLVRIGDAIQYAHDKGVIHRDLKPSNILLGPGGAAKVTDFGIALVAADAAGPNTAELIGTPHYMSPEQAGVVSSELDFRTDIFSLGVGLYRVLTSRLPFTGETMTVILNSICNDQPRSPRAINAAVDRDLTTICMKALEKNPRERYQSVAHFSADLRSWLRGDPILASPPSPARRVRHFVRRHRVVTVSAVAMVVIVGLLVVAVWPRQGHRARLLVESPGADGATVYSRLLDDPVGGGWGGRLLGRTPLNALVEPGVHRVTIIGGDGAFAQTVRHALPATDVGIALPLRAADDTGMVLVPGGVYTVGQEGGVGTFAAREVRIDPFMIDLTEVSNAQYKAFLDATGEEEMQPVSWQGEYRPEWADLPVVALRHDWMQAYAAWAGKRLPTMEEWQAAWQAGGPFGRVPPVGIPEEWSDSVATDAGFYRVYSEFAAPVVAPESWRGVGLGLSHMEGNVREATSTRDPGTGYGIVYMGASFGDERVGVFAGDITVMPPTGLPDVLVGFRCVRSVGFKQEGVDP